LATKHSIARPVRTFRFHRLLLAGVISLGLGCASTPETIEFGDVPSAEELYQEATGLLDERSSILFVDTTDYQGAIDRFQDIIDNYPYSEYAVTAELRIADAYFEQDLFEEALTYYRDFAELHPTHEKVPFAVFRTALCHARQTRPSNRDQTATREALVQLDQVMTRFPFSPEAGEAEVLWRELRTILGQSVMGIGNFYLTREEYQSAADRYRSVLNDFPGLGLDAEALYKLGTCYSHMNLEDQATRIYQVILENYEGSEVAEAVQDLVPAAN